MTTRLLIKNGIIITLDADNPILYDHAILIEDGFIKKIAKAETIKEPIDKTIDAANKTIMPGLINAHMHFYSTLVRGLTKAKPSVNFQEILNNLWWRLDKQLTLEDTYISTMVMLLNAIRHGTTTFIDHHASPNAVLGSLQKIAAAIKTTGLRGCLCYEVSDRDGEAIAEEGLRENSDFIKYCQQNPNDQLKALFGLHASFTVSNETLAKAAELVNDLNSGFHVHTAEAASDQEKTLALYGERVVERFKTHKVLGPKTICAHCVHINEHEMDLLAETNTMVAHNPQSNMNNGVGIADIVKMQAKEILVGLGTDAMTVNMFEEQRVALWAQHLRANPAVGFMEAANTLFSNNAKITTRIWDEVKLGILKEGYAADVILIDYIPPTPLTAETILGHLIFGISQNIVDTTIAKGKILMENKILTIDVDEHEIAAKAMELTKKLWDRF